MGPRNGIVGDDATNYGMDMPETATLPIDVTREKNMARFSQSKEFKALKKTIEARIEYHKKYSPGSLGETAFRDMPNEERGWRSLAADVVIEELSLIIKAYETANEVVKDAEETSKRRRAAKSSANSPATGA